MKPAPGNTSSDGRPGAPRPIRLKRALRFVLFGVTAVLLVALVPYVLARWHHAERAVSVEERPGQPSTSGTRTLRVATWNIAHGRGDDPGGSNWEGGTQQHRRARLQSIGWELSDRDVVILNEVDFDAAWSGGVDQAAVIAEAGEFPYILRQRNCDVRIPFFTLRFGNAILSRFPIVHWEYHKLPPYSPMEAFFAGNHDTVEAHLEMPDSTTLAVWALHLEVKSANTRAAAAQYVFDAIRERPGPAIPTLVAGDLNSTGPALVGREDPSAGPNALDILASLTPTAYPPPDVGDPTFPSNGAVRTIDWIFAPAHWRVLSGRIPPTSLSDHAPVFVDFGR